MRFSHSTSMFTLMISFIFVFSITSCKESVVDTSNSEASAEVVTPTPEHPRNLDTISCPTFNDWTTRWQRKGQQYTADNNVIKFYDLPVEDLKEIIEEMPASSRFFLGLDSSQAPGGSGVITYTPHLVVVGTDSNGDILYDPSKGQNIYDVSRPCPPYCPSSSDTIQCN